MIAIDSVIVVPLVFARPAGLIDSASPSSADATAAPARDVDTAPEPGRNRPPACATGTAPTIANPASQRSFM
jgi:hypothetical protein